MADDHDMSRKDGSSRRDQIVGFIGAVGFVLLLVYTQANN